MSTQGWSFIDERADRDSRGQLIVEKRYKVWGYTGAAVRNDPTAIFNAEGQSLPGFGTGFGGLALDRYDISDTDRGIVEATAIFSTSEIGILPVRPSQERVGYQANSLDTWDGVIEVPFAVRQDYIAPGGDLTEPVEFQSWVISTQQVRSGFSRRQFRTTRASMSPADFEAIEDQTGKLHLLAFGGTPRYYQFEGARVSQQDRGPWSVQYSWVREDGLPYFAVTYDQEYETGQVSIQGPPFISADDIRGTWPQWGEEGAWSVPPYHKISLTLNPKNPLNAQPIFTAILAHDPDNEGWLTLPGLP